MRFTDTTNSSQFSVSASSCRFPAAVSLYTRAFGCSRRRPSPRRRTRSAPVGARMDRGPLAGRQTVLRHLTNAVGDAPSVVRTERENSQNGKVECALQEIGSGHSVLSNDEGTIRGRPQSRQERGQHSKLGSVGTARGSSRAPQVCPVEATTTRRSPPTIRPNHAGECLPALHQPRLLPASHRIRSHRFVSSRVLVCPGVSRGIRQHLIAQIAATRRAVCSYPLAGMPMSRGASVPISIGLTTALQPRRAGPATPTYDDRARCCKRRLGRIGKS